MCLTPPGDGRCFLDSLPTEILVKIFVDVRIICLSDDEDVHGVPAWVAPVTHTCSRWRSIALTTPPFWAMVSRHMSFAWQQTFIERSGNVPLKLALHFPTCSPTTSVALQQRTSKACDLVQAHLWRMTELWLTFDTPELYPDLTRVLDMPAHELRTFHLEAPELHDAELRLDVIQRQAPNLTVLSLNNILFKWSSLAFSGLVSLHIIQPMRPSDRDHHFGTVYEFLDSLATLPKLQRLELEGSLYLDSADAALPRIVSLPQLKTLRFNAYTDIVVVLLHLNLPETTRIQLALATRESMRSLSMIKYLRDHFHAPLAMNMMLSQESFCFDLSMRPAGSFASSDTSSSPLNVVYERTDSDEVPVPPHFLGRLVITVIVHSFDMRNLAALHIDGEALSDIMGTFSPDLPPPMMFWSSMFRNACALEELCVKGGVLPELCSALSLRRNRSDPVIVDGKPELYMPSLRRLILCEYSFDPLVAVAKRDIGTIYWDHDGRPVAQNPQLPRLVRDDDKDTPQSEEITQEDVLEWIWGDARFAWILALRNRAERWRPIDVIELKGCTGLPEHWARYFFGPACRVLHT